MEKQPELFNEFSDAGIKNKPFGKGIFPERTFTLTFTHEKLIMLAIISILTLAVVFVFGFEKGKKGRLAKNSAAQPIIAKSLPAAQSAPVAKVSKAEYKTPSQSQQSAQQVRKQATEETKKVSVSTLVKPYTIQVATFKSRELMQQEAIKLKKKGFATVVIESDGKYRICVGEYANSKEALQTLSALQKIYKDCFLRKR
jgi:cell division protein FtsN